MKKLPPRLAPAASPTPEEVKAARINSGLTQRECAEAACVTLRYWQKLEDPKGGKTVRPGTWELFLLKTGGKGNG